MRQRWLRRLMANKTKVTPQNEEVPKKEAAETAPDSPLLDLSAAAVKKLIRSAKKRGYVTHGQINSVLPSEEVNSKQIEDVPGNPGRASRLTPAITILLDLNDAVFGYSGVFHRA
jgi:Sigma-70 factor, region 1.1